jgi:hypothetical protein
MSDKSKGKETPAERDAAELRRRDDTVARAAEEWARGTPLSEVRRLALATPGSWLCVEIPFTPYYRPPADGLYHVMLGPDADLDGADEIDSFWQAVLDDDAALIDDPAVARVFVDRVREVYSERVAAARG